LNIVLKRELFIVKDIKKSDVSVRFTYSKGSIISHKACNNDHNLCNNIR